MADFDLQSARFMVDAEALLRAAHRVCRAMPSQFDEHPGGFGRLAVALGEAIRHLGPHAVRARSVLEPSALVDGHSVDLADGSRLTVEADGTVRHSVPDSVLIALGMKPAKGACARDGGTLPLPRRDASAMRLLARHDRHRHAKGGDAEIRVSLPETAKKGGDL